MKSIFCASFWKTTSSVPALYVLYWTDMKIISSLQTLNVNSRTSFCSCGDEACGRKVPSYDTFHLTYLLQGTHIRAVCYNEVLESEFSLLLPGFDLRLWHVEFVVDKVALGTGFLLEHTFSWRILIPPDIPHLSTIRAADSRPTGGWRIKWTELHPHPTN
jgi:hypothetical protein